LIQKIKDFFAKSGIPLKAEKTQEHDEKSNENAEERVA